MRFAFLLPVFVAAGTVAAIVAEGVSRAPDASAADAASPRSAHGAADARFTDIDTYTDPELALDVAFPASWSPIDVVDDAPGTGADALAQTGRVIGFEAPRDGPSDAFADYVMIEILPGRESGLFLTDGSRTEPVTIDGVEGFRDSLVIEGHEVGGVALDLVVHQAEIRGLGWTVGFYAIGETRHAELVAEAFELMIRSFRLSAPPFRVV